MSTKARYLVEFVMLDPEFNELDVDETEIKLLLPTAEGVTLVDMVIEVADGGVVIRERTDWDEPAED